ncbi:MAG: spermidine/putrescine ABC transporter substrate-binding protein [Lachnospiraceae bacterium]|nr:spermidine/putrescine ABC transporter substrate-binding protein [Lachnospiraceae bacterium]
MKKKMLALAMSFACMIMILTGCGSSSENEDKDGNGYADELYLYNWSEYMIPEILEDFEKEYGIKVVETVYESNDEMLAKLLTGSEGEFDIAVPTNFFIGALIENDLLEPFDEGAITNLDNIYKDYLDLDYDKGNKYTVPYMGTAMLTIGNTKKLEELGVEIKKAEDLLNEKLKDNVVVVDDNEAITNLAMMGLDMDPSKKDVKSLKNSKKFLMDLNKNVKSYAQVADGRTMLARNEIAAAYIYSGDSVQAMNENKDLEIVMKESPVSLSIDNFVLLKGSRHKKEAQLFIDFVLRPENYAKLEEEFAYVCLNEAAVEKLPQELAQNPACVLDAEMKANLFLIGEKSEEVLSETTDLVTEVKSAK